MAIYEIVLRGDNFLVEREGGKARMSFFASRYMEAPTVQVAELAAVNLIRSQLAGDVLNDRDDTPIITMEGYNTLASAEGVEAPGKCFLFFRAIGRSEPTSAVSKSRWRRWLEKD